MTADPTPAPPARPSLETQPCTPDVTVRLRALADRATDPQDIIVIADALDAITGLRETCERRLATINDLKRLLQRVTLDSEWSCMAADVQADIEAALAGSRPSEGR